MASFAGLNKTRETIRLDDSANSPEFVIDFTDTAILSKQVIINDMRKQLQELKDSSDDGEENKKLQAELSIIYKTIIDSFMGDGSYKIVVDFVSDGYETPETETNIVIMPLVTYLLERFAEVTVPESMRAAKRKYLDE